MDSNEIFKPYAVVALAAKKELEEVESRLKEAKDKAEIAILKRQMGDLKHFIDRCFRHSGDFIPVHASKRALEYCSANDLGDLFSIGWGYQKKFERPETEPMRTEA